MPNDRDQLYPSQELDENELAAENNELSFENDEGTGRVGDRAGGQAAHSARRARRAGLTDASLPGEGATEDDATPETLIDEDGSRSPREPAGAAPPDRKLNIKNANEAGLGQGLDEEELAHLDPLDGEPWVDDKDL